MKKQKDDLVDAIFRDTSDLKKRIKALRYEAFLQGYDAARARIVQFLSDNEMRDELALLASASSGLSDQAAGETVYVRRPRRGTNANIIEEVLKQSGAHPLGATDIQFRVREIKHVDLAYSSIRHALRQLVSKGTAEEVGNTRTWRYVLKLRSVK